MVDISDEAADVFRDFVSPGSSVVHEPDKSEIRALFAAIDTELATIAANQTGGVIGYETWSALAAHATTGLGAGDLAKVYGPDAGTHTDPVAGGSVANKGIYRWSTSPAGWKRISDLPIDDLASYALSSTLSTETATRASADTSLTARLSTEEAGRGTADTSLTTRLSTEEGTRSSADTSLSARISAVTGPKKNLFDKTQVRVGKRYSPGSDQVITDALGRCTHFIPVTPGQQISISGGETGFTGGWFATASDTGTSTDLGFASGATQMTATVPAGRYFLVVNLTTSGSTAYDDTLQVEVGATPTAYEAYEVGVPASKVGAGLPQAQVAGLVSALSTLTSADSSLTSRLSTEEVARQQLTGMLVPKKNLFDKTQVRVGKRYSPGSDQVITDALGRCTHFIPVTPGQQISISGGETGFTGGWFATASDTGTSTDLGFASGATQMTATVPAGRYFLVVNLTTSGSTAYDNTLQVEVGAAPTAYEAYTLVIGLESVEAGERLPILVQEPGTNLIDLTKVDFAKRYSVASNTFVTDAEGIAASDWIEVEEGETYTLSGAGAYTGWQGGYFTAYGALTAPSDITWFSPPDGNGKSFTVPNGQGITHVVVSLRKLNDLAASTTLHGDVQLQQGEVATAHEPFELAWVIAEANLPKSVSTGSGAVTTSFDEDAWLRYVEGENQPSHLDKWPVFRGHYLRRDKDVTVVLLGTSLTARSTEHHSEHPAAAARPPLLHSLNLASLIWDRLVWSGQAYARYDASGKGTEPSGSWATAYNLAEWDDGGYRNGLTRYSADAAASFTREVPAGANSWRLIYRADSVAPTVVTVAVSGGNGQMQVYDEGTSAWVEANGYTFSQREAAPTTRSISIPNPDTDAFASSTIASKGNTTYQKRLRFRCKWTGVDTRNTAKTVTFTNTSGGRLNYWGHEWSPRPYMITLINAARGSHNTQATQTTGLPRYADNEVHGFKPDLIYMELPIHNDGAAGVGIYSTWDRWGRLTNNYVFRSDYELALLTRAAALGYTPEIGMWTPSIAYGFGGIGEDGQLLFSDQTDGTPMTALDKFDQAAAWVHDHHPEVVFVNAVHRWVEAGVSIYGDLKTATQASSKTGPSMTNDGGHPNDIGSKILAKVVLGPFCWGSA